MKMKEGEEKSRRRVNWEGGRKSDPGWSTQGTACSRRVLAQRKEETEARAHERVARDEPRIKESLIT